MLRQPGLRAARRAIPTSRPGAPQRPFTLRARKRSGGDGRAVERLNPQQLAQQRRDYEKTRMAFLMAGTAAGLISLAYTGWKLKQALERNPTTRLDSALPPTDPLASSDGRRKVIVHGEDGREIVPTGNSTVPEFPRTVEIPASYAGSSSSSSPSSSAPSTLAISAGDAAGATTEYTLVGLGLRTVSFLSIQVYVVGFYVATADVAALQARLVKRVNPIATTLVAGERDQLRAALLDPDEGEAVWDSLLAEGVPARSLFRVVPVRDTDFHHLRDGFVRAIQARASGKLLAAGGGGGEGAGAGAGAAPATAPDFGESMRQFRQLFNRGKVPKRKELLLLRDGAGRLGIAYDDGTAGSGRQFLGTVEDERVSRALWLNYLAGRKVASEPARASIVEGVMEFVERPIGTVATQVV